MKTAFHSDKTRKVEWRKNQLVQLQLGLEELADEIGHALQKDLGRDHFSSYLYEVANMDAKIKYDISNLDQWMKPWKRDTPLVLAPAKSRVVFQPLGVVCILGAWNFPLVTTLLPLVSAISAGNCVLVKPSEMSSHSSSVIRKLVQTYMDNDCIKVVEGGAEVSIACSQKKWDKICFTGSSEKGKLVAQAAAKNLVPCMLELGGKCITIVDETANAQIAASKVISGRNTNCGQICIAPDYVFVHESLKQEFIDAALEAIKNNYGEDPQKAEFYARIVNEFHTERVLNLTKNTGGKILCGGTADIKAKYVAPTIIEAPSLDSKVMKEEIFGPVLPV